MGEFEIFVANSLSELALPLQWQACLASVLVDTCGAGGVQGGLETNPGSAWLCWVVLRLGPLEVSRVWP